MRRSIENIEEVINKQICGFHQYQFKAPRHISYASKNLCELLGRLERDFVSEKEDLYLRYIHPADKNKYLTFLEDIAKKECTKSLSYRLIKKDASVILVNDTMTTKRVKGVMVGTSVLSDITELKEQAKQSMPLMSAGFPFGYVRYTCEKIPKLTYINDEMLKILRVPEEREGELNYLEMYKSNLNLLFPMETRRKFALLLNRVYTQGERIAGEIPVLRCDGTKAHVFGWVTKSVNEKGEEEFVSVCMDVTDSVVAKKKEEAKRYIQALSDVYDKIFEYDIANKTVKCLWGQKSSVFRWFQDIPMEMETATDKWVESTVWAEDIERVKNYFRRFYQGDLSGEDEPQQIKYKAYSTKGKLQTYCGIFLKIDATTSWYCCRCSSKEDEVDSLRDENMTLKADSENMNELFRRATDGAAAFKVTKDLVTPLYASDNICEFFGFSKEQWMSMMDQEIPINKFLSMGKVEYDDFASLLETGEDEFSFFDVHTHTMRRVKAICSQKSPKGNQPRYVMLYNVEKKNSGVEEVSDEKSAVAIRTFGYFDVFVNQKPIAFRSQKSKELFALLVDRRGGYITSEEAISFLWEDEPISTVTLARYRKVALRLKNMLEEYGIADVMESVDGKRRIVTDKVKCDLYDYLSGKEEYAQLFKGSYLTNYSWAEVTLGELLSQKQ